jgi:hypothetical protein
MNFQEFHASNNYQLSTDFHRQVEDMVRENVYQCASQLVSHMVDLDIDNIWDDFPKLLEWYPETAEDKIQAIHDNTPYEIHDIGREYIITEHGTRIGDDEILSTVDDIFDFLWGHDGTTPTDFKEEIYEHWLVSGWFAEQLERMGEAIESNFHGLTIWGRRCTGQSIAMDSVIQEICYNTTTVPELS